MEMKRDSKYIGATTPCREFSLARNGRYPSSAPRLDGNFDTRKVSKLPSFLHKNGKKQGFERKIIVKTLLFGCAYFFYTT